MSPAAVDLITLPPIEPPTPPAPTSAAGPGAPSFHDHLKQAERRSGDDDHSSRTQAESSSGNGATEARGTNDAPSNEKSSGDEKAEDSAQSDKVTPTQGKKQGGEKDPDEKSDKETGAECVVAAVVAQQDVDALKTIKTDVVEVTVEPVAAAAQTDAAKAAIVVEAAATPKVAEEAEAALKTEVVAEAPVELVPKTSNAKSTNRLKADAAQHSAAVSQTTLQAAGSIKTVLPAAAAVEETKTETDDAKSDAGTEPKVEAAAATPVVDPTVQQVVAAAETIVDAVTATTDDGPKHRDKDHQDRSQGERQTEATRTDRPHTGEPARTHAGREGGGARTQATEGSSHLSQGDRVRLVERVARAVHTAEQRGGELKIRLSPPELGSLRLQVKLTDGTLTARIETETHEARQVLVDNLPQLREKLSDQNIRVERFDIDLFNSGYGGAPQHSREEFEQAMQSAAGRNRNRETGSEAAVGAVPRSGGGALARNDGRLDITI